MAAKKSKNAAAAAVSPIDVTSSVKGTDVVLVNRNQADYQTNVTELAKSVGSELNIDGLAVGIDANAENINEIAVEIGLDINGNGGQTGDSLSERLGKLENHNFEGGAAGAGDNPLKGTHQERLDVLEAEVGVGGGGGGGGGGSITDQIDGIDEEQALQDAWIGRTAGSAAPAKSNVVRITELEGGLEAAEGDIQTNKTDIATNAQGIATNASEIAKLQGALVYKGVADFNQAPPEANAGEYYAASGSTATPNAGWGATGTVEQGDFYAFDGDGWAKVGNTDSVHDVVDDFHVVAKSGNSAVLTYQNATEMDAALVQAVADIATKLGKDISQLPALPV
jgi:hypothetical protein